MKQWEWPQVVIQVKVECEAVLQPESGFFQQHTSPGLKLLQSFVEDLHLPKSWVPPTVS
ncbi:hypothetical protein MHYP_G00015410 [Metynnis hypsauchen]